MHVLRAPRSLAGLLFAAVLSVATANAAAAPPARVVLPDDTTPDRYRIEIVPDAAALTFAGTVDIDLTVHRPTRRIVLNSADLVIDGAALADRADDAPRVATDDARQTAAFIFARPVAPGAHTLRIAYHGTINQNAAGLFALSYATPHGPRKALFTQFENSDARRFVPCWDEPARKATFELSAVVPADEMALSNMPVAGAEALPGGRQRVRFLPTPKMSTYLLYFGSGDFERAHRRVDGVDVGVVVRRGELANAAFALDAASRMLPWYNDYFGTPYPLPKLDMIAGPGASQFFGAMENWGAIFYFEPALLVDPRVATERDRQEVFSVVAHEMAHQWFGNLVTMAWWDDLWLNEGFASWMETKVSEHFHPEWRGWLRAQEEGQAAMAIDARAGTHPVITPIVDVLQAADAFDTITYSKGKMVIRTLESYVGEQGFRDGVRRYMAAHAYGNTTTDDLWREIDRGSTRPVAGIAHDLTRQAGVPLIRELGARCVDGRTIATLAQSHFAIDAAATSARTWRVPIALATLGGPVVQTVVGGAAAREVSVPGCGPLLLNAGQASYLRVRYDAAGLRALTAAYAALAPADQLGVLNDARSLALGAQLPMAALLDLLRAVPATADPVVLAALVDRLRGVDSLMEGLPLQAGWRAFARARLAPVRARLGWDRTAGESANEIALRAAVLSALAAFGDDAVRAEARARFERFVAAPASLDAETRRSVLRIVAREADAATWDVLHRLARHAQTESERAEGYTLLASPRDATLARRALDLSLSGEPPATAMPQMIAAVAVLHPRLAVDFAVARWPAVEPMIEPDSRGQFVPLLAAHAWDLSLLPVVERFARAHIPAGARQELRKTEAGIRDQARIRRERMPEVARWLAQAGP